MARKKLEPVDEATARTIGGLLRDLRRAAGYRAVRDAAARPGCPAAQQTIYAYERGGLVPSLKQFMELVEFYAFGARDGLGEDGHVALRYQARGGDGAGPGAPRVPRDRGARPDRAAPARTRRKGRRRAAD